MAQLPDSEAVFIDLAQARILQTLETPSMLMKTLAGDPAPITQLASHFLFTIMEFHQLHLDIGDQNLYCSTFACLRVTSEYPESCQRGLQPLSDCICLWEA